MFKYLIFFLLISIQLFSYTNIYPLTFDERIDGQGGYKEYTLTNVTNKTLRYKIYEEKIQDTFDMSKWVERYPKILTLKPGEKGKLNILVTSPKGTKNGEYLMNLCIKEIGYPSESLKSEIEILTNLKIELAGVVGDLKPRLDLKINKNKVFLKNIGDMRYTFELYLQDSKDKKSFIQSVRLFSKEKKDILLNEKLLKNMKKLIVTDKNGDVLLEKRLI